jgi:hypothetical protein
VLVDQFHQPDLARPNVAGLCSHKSIAHLGWESRLVMPIFRARPRSDGGRLLRTRHPSQRYQRFESTLLQPRVGANSPQFGRTAPQTLRPSLSPGTDGSNLPSSTGESDANLTSSITTLRGVRRLILHQYGRSEVFVHLSEEKKAKLREIRDLGLPAPAGPGTAAR